MTSKPRRKRLSIESASARPTCEGCKQSSSVPDGQENEAIQQLDGDWLCPRHLSEALDEGAFFNWLVRVLGLAQKGAGTHAYLLINLLLGWTVFGWFVAFAWALSGRDYRGSSPTMTEVVTPSREQPPRKRWKPTKIQRSASSRWP